MQQAIETGRLIRDRVGHSIKYPLAKVKLVDADPAVIAGYTQLQHYIKEELNCVALETDTNEDAYIEYSVAPDNRALGQAFGKRFNKDFKKKLAALTNEDVKGYLQSGSILIGDCEVLEGMLKVQKDFTAAVKKDKNWGVESKGTATVMLDVVMTPELKRMGLSREITNRIQRLRKTSGISIDDQIDIYYEVQGEAPELTQTLAQYVGTIEEITRMPVVQLSQHQSASQ